MCGSVEHLKANCPERSHDRVKSKRKQIAFMLTFCEQESHSVKQCDHYNNTVVVLGRVQ